MKPCRRCGKLLPLRSFKPHKGGQDGLSAFCATCEAHPALRNHDDPGYQTCRKCRIMLPLTEFPRRGKTCRECVAFYRQVV